MTKHGGVSTVRPLCLRILVIRTSQHVPLSLCVNHIFVILKLGSVRVIF